MSIVVFDFETGGIEPYRPSIQLAAIAVDGRWNEIDAFERKIRFDVASCDAEALRVNRYDPKAWEDADIPSTVFNDFCVWIDKHRSIELISKRTGNPYSVARLAAYNAGFDKDRLWNMSDGCFVPAHPQPLCIMQLAAWSITAGALQSKSLKLSDVAAALGISADGAHDALADVRMSAAIAKVLALRLSVPEAA